MPCKTVTVEPPDESELSVQDVSVSSPAPNTIEATANVVNTVRSGSGTDLEFTIQTTVDGSEVDSRSGTVSAGTAAPYVVTVEDVSPSDHEVCVQLV